MSDEKWETYLYSYRHDGKQWGFELQATSFDDAQARLAAIHFTGELDGVLGGTIPVNEATALPLLVIARTYTWIRNLWRNAQGET